MYKNNAGIKTRAKVAKLDRNRSTKIDLLHKWLTRVDIEKDNNELTKRGQEYAKQITNAHFGKLDVFKVEYKEVCAQVNQTTCTSFGTFYRINMQNKKENATIDLQHIKRGFYDAGLSPLVFSDQITIVLTPASYLDPAKKTWSPAVPEPFGFDLVLNKSVFETANIPVSSLVSRFNEKTGEAFFQIDFGFAQLKPFFDSSLTGFNEDAKLFFARGNKKKMEWFDDPYALHYDSCSKEQTALLYISCKEMGDLLQAYYAKEYLAKRHHTQRKHVSLFTNDKLMVRRCQLYGVPVVLSTTVNIENMYVACYYIVPAMDNLNDEMLLYYRRYIKGTNDGIIHQIMSVIEGGFYKMRNGVKVPISDKLKRELHRLCSEINKKVKEFLDMQYDHAYMTLEEYRQLSCYYISTHIIDKSQKTFNELPDSLFIMFKDTELVYLKTLIQYGGGNNEFTYLYDFSADSQDFTAIRWLREDEEGDMLEHYAFQTLVLNIFYERLKMLYPEKSKDELCFRACDLFAIASTYFVYLGITPLQRTLYDECIRMFQTQLPSFEEFLKMYVLFDTDLDTSQFSSLVGLKTKLKAANANKHTNTRPPIPVLVSGKRRTRKNKVMSDHRTRRLRT